MLYGAAVVPHGDEIINPENNIMKALHDAMLKVSDALSDADEYILISPHNLRIDTHIGVILTENLHGAWEWGNVKLEKTLKSDRTLATNIYQSARDSGIPVVGVNFGALEGPLSAMPLDWGALIPLHFLEEKPTVLITPARQIDRHDLFKFGEILAKTAENASGKIAMIVSADQAHAHSPRGPYGYSPAAKEYDSQILKILKSGALSELLERPQELIDSALPDSYWQLLMLAGAQNVTKMHSTLVEYGVADYFGMAVALFERDSMSR